MRLTGRGWAALAVVAVAIVLAWAGGERALNAIAAPTLAAVAFGAVVVWRADPPTVSLDSVDSGSPGDERTLAVSVEGGALVSISLALPDGIDGADVDDTVVPADTVERSVTLASRGIYRLAVEDVTQRDPLGFVERRVDVDASDDFVVYPPVSIVDAAALERLLTDDPASERQEFDRLREYVPGDSLRDVHWKSSAKRDDLLVMEFTQPTRSGSISIVGDAADGHADEMAAATATLAIGALELGLDVAVTVPADSLPAGRGERHRESLLRLLARTDAGTLPASTHEEADLTVRADAEGTHVWVEDRQQTIESVIRAGAATGEGVA